MTKRRRIIEKCNICDGTKFSLKFEENYLHSDIVQCQKCEFVFSNPQVEINYKGHHRYIQGYLKTEKGRRLTAQWRLQQLPKEIKSGKLLEVGCSGGFFLDEARKLGFDVVGTELNQEAVEYARETLKLTVYDEADLSSVDFGNRFDAIVLFNVLEHLPTPRGFLDYIIDNLLSESGVLLIEVPNIFTIQSKFFGTKNHHLSWAHYSYYSKKTFRFLAERVELEIIDFKFGKRIYPLEGAKAYFRRTRILQRIAEVIVDTFNLNEKIVHVDLHEFLFFVCKKKYPTN